MIPKMDETEMSALLEGIKKRYDDLRDKEAEHFPTLYYKSTVAPYEHLIRSLEKHVTRPYAIPSAKTFSKIFHGKYIIQNPTILDTLYRYAFSMDRQKYLKLNSGASDLLTDSTSIEVSIDDPVSGQYVDRILKAAGSIQNASDLWIVVRPSVSFNYWVQKEPRIDANGRWESFVHIGSADPGDIGITYEICAFVNPKIQLTVGEALPNWPEAFKSSSIVEVIRK